MSGESEREFVGHGRYALDQLLGAGGAGSVYLAYDTSLARWVAIKRIPATDETLFLEATVLASFQHPNIVTIYDVLQEGGEMLLVMEFVQGQTLEELAEPLAQETFRNFAAQCLEGLGAAHEKNIVHRDIKPGNIMFVALSSGGYRAKILDFGQSRLMQAPSLQTIDQSGAVIGSIYMMSPEQLNHEELDLRTDFYSLGCVFYQALTLQRPFNGASVAQVLAAHLQHRFVPLASLRPDLPRPLTFWVERLFSLDKNDRPANALEALRGLNATFGSAGGINIASHSTTGVRVAAAPVLKPILVAGQPQIPIRVAGSAAVPISTPIAVAASARPVSGVWPLPTPVSSPIAVAATPVTEPVPRVRPVATPVSTPITVASAPVVKPVPVVWPLPTPVSTPIAVAAAPVVSPLPMARLVSTPIVVAMAPDEEVEPVAAEMPESYDIPQNEAPSIDPEVSEYNSVESEETGPEVQDSLEPRKPSLPLWAIATVSAMLSGSGSAFAHPEFSCEQGFASMNAAGFEQISRIDPNGNFKVLPNSIGLHP